MRRGLHLKGFDPSRGFVELELDGSIMVLFYMEDVSGSFPWFYFKPCVNSRRKFILSNGLLNGLVKGIGTYFYGWIYHGLRGIGLKGI